MRILALAFVLSLIGAGGAFAMGDCSGYTTASKSSVVAQDDSQVRRLPQSRPQGG
jgi:hypothetical protein